MPERDLLRAEAMLRRLKGATSTLLGGRAAFTCHPGSRKMFLRAMRESFAHHFVHNEAYRELCRAEGFTPAQLRQESDLSRLPVGGLALTASPDKVLLRFEGVPLDGISIRRLRKLVRHVYAAMGLTDRRRGHRLGREMPLPELVRVARRLADPLWIPEHGVPYVRCPNGSLHVPRYAHVHVQEDGRLRLLTPWPHSYAGLSVQSDRRGRLLSSCACGRRSDVLDLL